MKKYLGYLLMAFAGAFIAIVGNRFIVQSKQFETTTVIDTSNQPIKVPAINMNSMAATSLIDFTEAADKTLNAVVHVKNTSVKTYTDPFSQLLFGNGTPQKFSQVGTGSGVIISGDGYIVTNNHVIEGASEIEITLNTKKTFKAALVGADPTNDIALLKIEEKALPYIPFGNSDNIQVGEWVLAVGNPYNLTSTVTAGIVSAKGRDLKGNSDIESFIQTDAAVNPGNSGGALVNTRGELIGINTMITSQTGSFIGYSFAVPSNIAKKVVEDLMEYGNVQRALLGISYSMSNDAKVQGVFIESVSENGGAKKAGLQSGDVIVRVDGVVINNFSDLKGKLNSKRPHDQVSVTVIRNASEITKLVTLSEKTDMYISALGITVEKMTKKEAEKKGLKAGVKIIEVASQQLKEMGIDKGSVLLSINSQPISNLEALEVQLKNLDNFSFLKIEVLNKQGGKESFVFRW